MKINSCEKENIRKIYFYVTIFMYGNAQALISADGDNCNINFTSGADGTTDHIIDQKHPISDYNEVLDEICRLELDGGLQGSGYDAVFWALRLASSSDEIIAEYKNDDTEDPLYNQLVRILVKRFPILDTFLSFIDINDDC
jgi:hypothetical protein